MTDSGASGAGSRAPAPWAEDPARWAETRAIVFARARWRCQECGRKGRGNRREARRRGVLALECDHTLPRESHPALRWDLRNLRALCRDCHERKTEAEGGERRARRLPESVAAWRAAVAELRKPL